jgi:hypothetical protein
MGSCPTKNKTIELKIISPSNNSSTSFSPSSKTHFNHKEEKNIYHYIKEKKNSLTIDEILEGLTVPCIIKDVKGKSIKITIALASYQIPTLRNTDYVFFNVVRTLDKPLDISLLDQNVYAHFLPDGLVNIHKKINQELIHL